jgi:hypothetical protein
MTSFWMPCQGEQLEQGDYLPGCWIPVVGADFDPAAAEPEISVGTNNLIIVTQSCDLANEKIQLAALCPIGTLATWEGRNPDYAKRGFWESVRQGRREACTCSAPSRTPTMREMRWSWTFGRFSAFP